MTMFVPLSLTTLETHASVIYEPKDNMFVILIFFQENIKGVFFKVFSKFLLQVLILTMGEKLHIEINKNSK